jgi:hypothetical protein
MTKKEERSLRIAQIRENFAKEGGVPDAEKEALLDCFVEGNATWADLFDYAYEYVTTAQEREHLSLAKEKAAVEFQRTRSEYEADTNVYKEEQGQEKLNQRGMSKEQRERHDAINAARASVFLSGGKISKEIWRDSLRYANCEMTLDEFLELRATKILEA